MINSIVEHIEEARREAIRMGIQANAVAISDRLFFSKLQDMCGDIPVVCGLKCVYANDLPNNAAFAVFKSNDSIMTKDEMIASLQKKNAELNDALEKAYEIIGRMIDR